VRCFGWLPKATFRRARRLLQLVPRFVCRRPSFFCYNRYTSRLLLPRCVCRRPSFGGAGISILGASVECSVCRCSCRWGNVSRFLSASS